MFTQEWVDTRTETEKKRDLLQELPQQLELFSAHLWLSLWADGIVPVASIKIEPSISNALMLSPMRAVTVFKSRKLCAEPIIEPRQLPAPPTFPLLGSGEIQAVQPDNEYFVARLKSVKPRLEAYVYRRWYEEFDVFERDNLIQVALVYLWQAFQREAHALTLKNDYYWLGIAKRGALYEISREHRTRFRRQGKRGTRLEKQPIVVSVEDELERRYPEGKSEELDPALLSGDSTYQSDTQQIIAADRRLDCAILVQQILTGTSEVDRPLIQSVLGFMREGLTQQEMARRKNVKVSTIRVTIRRIQQAAGAFQQAKENRKRPGISFDKRIQELRSRGLGGPAIARLIGMHPKFVYRRLEYIEIK